MKTKGITTFVSAVICSALLLVTLLGWNTVSPTSAQQPPVSTITVSDVTPKAGTIGTVVEANVVLVTPGTGGTSLTVAVDNDVVETFLISGMAVGDVSISEEGTSAITLESIEANDDATLTYTYALQFTAQKVGAGFTVEWTPRPDIYNPYAEPISATSETPDITLKPPFAISVKPTPIEWCAAGEDDALVPDGVPELSITMPTLSDNLSPTLKIAVDGEEIYNGDPGDFDSKNVELPYELPPATHTVTAELAADLSFTLPAPHTAPTKRVALGEGKTTYAVTECPPPPPKPTNELVVEAPATTNLYQPFDVSVWVKDANGQPVTTAVIGPLTYETVPVGGKVTPFAGTMTPPSDQAAGKFKAKPLISGTFGISATATVDGETLTGGKTIAVVRPGKGNESNNRGIAAFAKGRAEVNGFSIDFTRGVAATVAQTSTLIPEDGSLFIVDWDSVPFVAEPATVEGNEDSFLPASPPTWRLVPVFINTTILDPEGNVMREAAPYTFVIGDGPVAELSKVMSDTMLVNPSAQLTLLSNTETVSPTLATDACTGNICGTSYSPTGVPITALDYLLDSEVQDFGLVAEERGSIFLPIIRQP